ncbi:MAG: hypothetical protein GXP35_05070 [Actinobacteria bacterium]|nr:hypothetical protein [Actinomycetota bacterium]
MISNRRSISMFVAAALVLSACTSGASGSTTDPAADAGDSSAVQPAPTQATTQTSAAGQATTTSVAVPNVETIELTALPTQVSAALAAGEITNDGVLAAAVIIVSDGDLETAIADGIVTEAEADAAISALEAGTLHLYQG